MTHRLYKDICFDNAPFSDEDVNTITSVEQTRTEEKCLEAYQSYVSQFSSEREFRLWRQKTVSWLLIVVGNLSSSFQGLYASQAWLCYWIIHSIELLDGLKTARPSLINDMITLLLAMQSPMGGFGGGPKQEPHILATYAAINALLICGAAGGPKAMERVVKGIDRVSLRAFYLRMKVPAGEPNAGAFYVHEDGEVDTRGMYCLLSIASLMGILDDEITQGCAEWLSRCQGFDGGIGGEPGNEPHGGYSFCGVAAALLLKRPDCLNLEALLKWASMKQLSLEGGFCGRTNKLVDGCYSFWVGGIFPIIHFAKSMQFQQVKAQNKKDSHNILTTPSSVSSALLRQCYVPEANFGWLFNQRALQLYTLCCTQSSEERPGLMDKPGAGADLYHTCYCLSGLAVAQQSLAEPKETYPVSGSTGEGEDEDDEDDEDVVEVLDIEAMTTIHEPSPHIVGSSSNALEPNNHLYNLTDKTVEATFKAFQSSLQL